MQHNEVTEQCSILQFEMFIVTQCILLFYILIFKMSLAVNSVYCAVCIQQCTSIPFRTFLILSHVIWLPYMSWLPLFVYIHHSLCQRTCIILYTHKENSLSIFFSFSKQTFILNIIFLLSINIFLNRKTLTILSKHQLDGEMSAV